MDIFKKFILRFFSFFNVDLSKSTNKKELLSLIKSLHPVKSQIELIRLGPNSDGGYLLPNDLEGIKYLFSPGVDTVSEFEKQCLNLGMKVYMADKSVNKPNLDDKYDYNFKKKFIGITNDKDHITMDEWINEAPDTCSDLLLQMDVEGAEYEILINMNDSLIKRFRIMVIEFHSLQKLYSSYFFPFAEHVFNKILKTHSCVHIHPNNGIGIDSRKGIDIPRTCEFTFLRNDRIKTRSFETSFPHILDKKNVKNKEEIILPKQWYYKK